MYANAHLADWLHLPLDKLLGARCDFASGIVRDNPASVVAGLAVPPDDTGATSIQTTVTVTRMNGTIAQAQALYVPLRSDRNTPPAWLIFVDLTNQGSTTALNASLTIERCGTIPLSPADIRSAVAAHVAASDGNQIEFSVFPGLSPDAERIRRVSQWIIASRADVFIWGPAYSGRAHLARAIVQLGSNQPGALPVSVDCRLMDAESLQRTLTATCRHQPASERSVLLREVDLLSAECAAELKGYLSLPNHGVRVLATAVRSLDECVAAGVLDSQLAARLGGLTLEIPPLRRRPEDIPLWAQMLLEKWSRGSRDTVRSFAPAVLKQFAEYTWPGEIGELRDVIRQAAEHCAQNQILLADLPDRFRLAHAASQTPQRILNTLVLDDYLADIERRLLERALRQARWNKSKAARALSISRARLIRRADQLGIQFPTDDIPFQVIEDEPDEG